MDAESVFVIKSPSELEASSSINIETKETSESDLNSKLSSIDQTKQIKELDSQILIAHQELTILQLENIELKRKLAPANRRQCPLTYFALIASNWMQIIAFIQASLIILLNHL